MRVRSAVVAAFVLSVCLLAGCADLQSSGRAAALTPSAGTDGSAGSAGSAATAASADQQCGGKVETVEDVEALISEPAGCEGAVNTFWRDQLGEAWTQPTYVAYRNGEIPPIACAEGVEDPRVFADNALYCSLDDTVAYSVDFMTDLYETGGASYPAFVVMHELGHRASRIGGSVGVISRSEENQADCFAGGQTRFANDAGRLSLSDAVGGALLFFSLGDTRGGWFDQEASSAPDAHGTPPQRAQAFSLGYLRDIGTCRGLGQSPNGNVGLF